MATGESQASLCFLFRVSKSWIGHILKEVIIAIKNRMFSALPQPTRESLASNGQEFGQKWHFPNVMGCLDGKHVRVRCPNKSGSLYYNYKDFFSVVLLALVGPKYEFMAIDVGSFGREGDAGIFSKCPLGRSIKEKLFDEPAPRILPNSTIVAPYIFLGDEAFPILENLLKPFPRNQSLHDRTKAIFNYRLSRARRIVENAFGMLTQNFRIFSTPINLNVDLIEHLITVACILHNLIIVERGVPVERSSDMPSNLESIIPVNALGNESDPNMELKYRIRDQYKDYFNSNGAVPWQNQTFRL